MILLCGFISLSYVFIEILILLFFSEPICKMSDLPNVLSCLKACVVSIKNGVALNKLDSKLSFLLEFFFFLYNIQLYFIFYEFVS